MSRLLSGNPTLQKREAKMSTRTSMRAGMDVSNSTGENTGYRVLGSGGATP